MRERPLLILLIDDDADDYRWLSNALETMEGPGCRLEWARSFDAARKGIGLRAHDVYLVGQRLGSHTGLEVLRLARGLEKATPAIYLTDIGDRAADLAAMRAGAADCLVKRQITPALLERTIRHSVERARAEAVRAQMIREQAARVEADAGQRQLAFLAKASSILASSLDVDATLQRILSLAVPYLADFCAVDMLTDEGAIRGLSVLRVDGAEGPPDERRYEHPVDDQHCDIVAHVLATGQLEQFVVLSEKVLSTLVCDDEQRHVLQRIGAPNGLVAPLLARGRVLGALTLIRSGSTAREGAVDLTLAQDLARRAATAVDNARLYSEAQEAIRSRDEFLSVAAHELRTPVTALRGFAQLALRQLHRGGSLDPQRGQLVLEEIEEQTAKLTRLVNQLLDVSRLDGGKLAIDCAPTDVVDLVRTAVHAARPHAPTHQISLRAPTTLMASLDALRIEQVVINLVDNAVKSSADDGPIEIEVSAPLPNTGRIAVRDHGVGISSEQRPHIFERFNQDHGDSSHWGMGLGLYISQQIAELHGGTLSVDFPPGGGSRFTLLLPLNVACEGEKAVQLGDWRQATLSTRAARLHEV